MKLLPSRRVLCTPYNHAPCHFMQSHIRKVYAYLAVTCHLHFWQNDRGLLRATAVTLHSYLSLTIYKLCENRLQLTMQQSKQKQQITNLTKSQILFRRDNKYDVNVIIIIIHTYIHTYIHTFSIALFPAERAQRA